MTNMNRRQLLQTLAAIVAASVIPASIEAAAPVEDPPLLPKRRLTIDQIMAVVFPAVKAEYLKGGRKWFTDELNQRNTKLIDFGQDYFGQDVEEVSYGITWTQRDENTMSEKEKIDFVTEAIKSAMEMTDELLLEKMGPKGRLVAAKNYQYELAPSHIIPDAGELGPAYYRMLYTVYVVPA